MSAPQASLPELVDEPPARPATADPSHAEEAASARPSGPAAAAVLAAGAACFTLGVLSIVTAWSDGVSDALTLSERHGDVSGLSTATIATFAAAWAALGMAWRRANPRLRRVAVVSAVLALLGLLGTFPPVFNAFGG